MELSIAFGMGLLATFLAASLDIPPLILFLSYPLCFIVGYGVGQWHRRHES